MATQQEQTDKKRNKKAGKQEPSKRGRFRFGARHEDDEPTVVVKKARYSGLITVILLIAAGGIVFAAKDRLWKQEPATPVAQPAKAVADNTKPSTQSAPKKDIPLDAQVKELYERNAPLIAQFGPCARFRKWADDIYYNPAYSTPEKVKALNSLLDATRSQGCVP